MQGRVHVYERDESPKRQESLSRSAAQIDDQTVVIPSEVSVKRCQRAWYEHPICLVPTP
jgi:hypothetical protein